MHRFFEGFLYPSYTGGVVVPFRWEGTDKMWTQFASLWKRVNPNSASYNFMQEPLLSGDVWIAFDHIARVLDALRQKPEQFVAYGDLRFPAPSLPPLPEKTTVALSRRLLLPGVDLVGVKLVPRRQLGNHCLVPQCLQGNLRLERGIKPPFCLHAHPSAPSTLSRTDSALTPGPIFGVRF
jgi:hypothetical protein